MLKAIIIAMLWSISPLGEAKVGIPYGIYHDANIYLVFITCFAANVLVFPIMIFFLEEINHLLLRFNFYKRSAIFVARRAKTGSGKQIQKYGFWGLMLFVMIPLPGTGVYAGSIASYIFKIEKKQAFIANTIGIFFSSLIVWVAAIASAKGLS